MEAPINRPVSTGGWPCNQPAVAVDPETPTTVLVSAYTHQPERRGIALFRSTDGGLTFDGADLPLPEGYQHGGSASIATGPGHIAAIAGVAYNHPARDGSIIAYRLTDQGASRSSPVVVRAGSGDNRFFDKPCIAFGQPGDPQRPAPIYVSYTGFINRLADSRIFFQWSLDGGATWTSPKQLSAPGEKVHGSSMAVGPNGVVYVAWIQLEPGGARLRVRRSVNGGQRFSQAITLGTVRPVPSPLSHSGWQFRVPTFAGLAVDTSPGPYRGRLYAVWHHDRFGVAEILLTQSRDEGKSWSYPLNVSGENGEAQSFFPAIAVSPLDGTVYVAYCTHSQEADQLDVVVTTSVDGGDSFSSARPVTDEAFDPNRDPTFGQPALFLGDYVGAAALPERRVFAVWTDTRTGTQAIYSGIR